MSNLVGRKVLPRLLFVLVMACVFIVMVSGVSLLGYQRSDDVVIARKLSRGHLPRIVRDTTSQMSVVTSSSSPVDLNEVPRLLFSMGRKSPLFWNSSLYLPLGRDALHGFLHHEEKQRLRVANNPSIKEIWSKELGVLGSIKELSRCGMPDIEDTISKGSCSFEVPECDFWLHVGNVSGVSDAPLQRRKCCSEHFKLKKTLFYVLDLVDAYNTYQVEVRDEPLGAQVFLDSGSLLSSVRDGGQTLIPWETDIDLGIIGGFPDTVSNIFSHKVMQRWVRDDLSWFLRQQSDRSASSVRNATVSYALHRLFPTYHRYWIPELHSDKGLFCAYFGSQGTFTTSPRMGDEVVKRVERLIGFSVESLLKGDPKEVPSSSLHYYEECLLKSSKNVSRSGLCRDAHYVFAVKTSQESKIDTGRVEIWPLHPDVEPSGKNTTDRNLRFHIDSVNSVLLRHPTRKKLDVSSKLVLPLLDFHELDHLNLSDTSSVRKIEQEWKNRSLIVTGNDTPRLLSGASCRLWGRAAKCPFRSHRYLDFEYGVSWRWPKTIHWGAKNVQPWRG